MVDDKKSHEHKRLIQKRRMRRKKGINIDQYISKVVNHPYARKIVDS